MYDAGYTVIRDRRIERMKRLGILPRHFQPNPGLPISTSTFIFFESDNGAEGATTYRPENTTNVDNSFANIGRPRSNIATGRRWAEVSDDIVAELDAEWNDYVAEAGFVTPNVIGWPVREGVP
jgi:arylsulfatase